MRNISDKSCRENENIFYVKQPFFFFKENRTVYEMMQKYSAARVATDENIIRPMRFACWITKATDTHS